MVGKAELKSWYFNTFEEAEDKELAFKTFMELAEVRYTQEDMVTFLQEPSYEALVTIITKG